MPFTGKIYDLRLFFGPGGFVETSDDLLRTTMVKFR